MTSPPAKRTRAAKFLFETMTGADSQVLETHISWVFLKGRLAYKLKKPVKFDFLDFSTPQLRRAACQNELELNRRLSSGVYLAVVPITIDPREQLQLGGDGEPIDWVVKMRRLDEHHTLESRLRGGELDENEVAGLAARLALFFVNQAPVTIRTDVYRQRFYNHIQSNQHDLLVHLPAASDAIHRAHAAQRRFLQIHAKALNDRVCDGRIVDGHGDLRPEHIYLNTQPEIIDCIEFNPEYRQNDIVDELGFLGMECHRLNASWIGDQVLREYRRLSTDDPPGSLVAFYKCYRACVRAKVAALGGQRAADHRRRSIPAAAATYLDVAQYYADQLGPQVLLIVGGLMGTGKSTLAQNLAEMLSAELLQTDCIRDEMYAQRSENAGFGDGKYSAEGRHEVYQEMARQAEALFRRNVTVVLDGTFSTDSSRQLAARTAERVGASCLHVECTCPRAVAIQRIAERLAAGGSLSEARPEFYKRQRAEYRPLLDNGTVLHVDTTLPLHAQTEPVIKAVQGLAELAHTASAL